MFFLSVGGYYLDQKGKRQQFPVVESPTLSEIEKYLEYSQFCGVLVCKKKGNSKTVKLIIHFDSGKFLPSLEISDGEDFKVFMFENRNHTILGYEYFQGEPFPRANTVFDKNLVISLLSEFITEDMKFIPSRFEQV
ncbi:DUF6911 family protein [Rheinheimera oceanensis]|uniref:DUF6911 family protein n=1 Tax=Rheinheimera oceanensis TaxID=2817449 RepID=UPI001BFDDAF7|nr:hypothetical protein [Rheinheimera oceanensis]